jgi:hypothetical protein
MGLKSDLSAPIYAPQGQSLSDKRAKGAGCNEIGRCGMHDTGAIAGLWFRKLLKDNKSSSRHKGCEREWCSENPDRNEAAGTPTEP